nr:retrotransposon protein, putative, Ty1-copia subclass [Tanacetum cinerariifolium]
RHILLGLPVNDFKKVLDLQGCRWLWIIKMRTLLIQHGCEAALEVLPVDMEAQTKAELNKKAHSAVILCLGNKVLREVTRETTAAGVWSKLETLYMTNSLANKLYLKKKLYTFYMSAGRKISKHIDEFNKIVLDLANIEVKFEDEELALLLLTPLPASYEHFGDTLLYGHEALTLEDVMATLNSKEIKEMSKTKEDDGGGLYVRGRTDRRDSRQSRGKSRSKSRDIFFDFLKCDEGNIQLGDNGECKIRGIGKVRVQLKDGSSFVLHGVRYIRELKRNLISLETLEKEGYTVKLQSGKVKVINGSTVILSGIRRDNCVYSLDGHAMSSELSACVKEKNSLAQVWHKRLRHISEEGLQEGVLLRECRLCSFRLIRSVSGGIIGRRTVKKLRTDNGLEFYNREFEQLCIESGIARHFTVFRTPQQNGVAERMNRTLMDKLRCLLIQSGLPKTFRAEVTCTATYLINRSPSREIEKKTPIEMWSGHLSDYEMLRIFNCVAYPHDKQANELQMAIQDKEGIEGVQKPRYKARLVARGFTQRPGIDYNKVFSLVVRHTSIRVILALTVCKDYELEQLDVKMAFLHRNLEEIIYMKQPLGYEQGNKVYLLKKSLYSLKQSPRQWYKRFDEYMLSYGFKRSSYDSCVYSRSYVPGEYIYLLLYVDDMLIAYKSKDEDFPVRDCDVERMSKVPCANAVGSIVYLMVCTRPDIAYAVTVVSRYLANLGKNYWEAVKWILKYLRDYAKDLDKEAEYMALTKAVKEAIWLRGLLEKLGVEVNTMAVNCDNQGAIHLSRNHVFHERTKHINMRYHFIREVLEAKTVKLLKVGTEHNVVDALSKVVPGLKLQHCLELLNVGKG